jgi:hypothetical protein
LRVSLRLKVRALMLPAAVQNIELCKRLLEQGSDPTLYSHKFTALGLARDENKVNGRSSNGVMVPV